MLLLVTRRHGSGSGDQGLAASLDLEDIFFAAFMPSVSLAGALGAVEWSLRKEEQGSFFFLDSITVHLGVQNPM